MFPQHHHEDEVQYHKRNDDIRSQQQSFVMPSYATPFYTLFYQRNRAHIAKEVCPSRTSETVMAQG